MEEEVLLQRLDEAIYITDKFLNVISDGYNRVFISMNRNEHDGENEDELLRSNIRDTQLEISGRDDKKKFHDLDQKLHETFNWSLMHLKTFNIAPKIFASKYHTDRLYEIMERICKNIIALFENQSVKQFEYFFDLGDGSECKALLMVEDRKSLFLLFWNEIH